MGVSIRKVAASVHPYPTQSISELILHSHVVVLCDSISITSYLPIGINEISNKP